MSLFLAAAGSGYLPVGWSGTVPPPEEGGEGPSRTQAVINTPPPQPPSSPKPFLILRCLQHHQCHAPVRQQKKQKERIMPIAIQAQTDLKKHYIFKQCNHKQETKRANGRVRVLKKKCLRKTNHAFFSHVCSCSVFFFFFNVSKWEEKKDYCNKTVILIIVFTFNM